MATADFFPLQVREMRGKMRCSWRFRGLNKREVGLQQTPLLTARLIDRPIRPMFCGGLS